MAGVPVKTALYEHLVGISAISTVIGDRLYPNAVGAGATLPYVTYQRRDYESMHHMGGASGLSTAQFRFTVQASTSLQAGTISEALRDNLDGLAKTNIGTSAPVFVHRCALTDIEDDFIKPTEADPIGKNRMRMDFDFAFTEAVPTASGG